MIMELNNLLELIDEEIRGYENFKVELKDRSGELAIDLKICALKTFREKVVAKATTPNGSTDVRGLTT